MASCNLPADKPQQKDLDRCVHCGLCLNACPTYRELGLEMDSPRGRIYQMVQVANGAPVSDAYLSHIDLCLACRACETACPSGVQYGRLVEAARADIETRTIRPWATRSLRGFLFETVLPSRAWLAFLGRMLWFYQVWGIQKLTRASGILRLFGKLGAAEALAPNAESPFFFSQIGHVFPAHGERKHKVALLSGCIANVCFARLNEATVRVLQINGCEVHVPAGQTCCGALHVHAGLVGAARGLARKNIDAVLDQGFDAVLTNAGGCGSTLKEYDHLLEQDAAYAAKAVDFCRLMKDVNEFLGSITLTPEMGELDWTVTYQDSCHLAHGQKIRSAPRELLRRIPGLTLKEMAGSDQCCGSAGIYNVVHTDMSMSLLEKKMTNVNRTKADRIVTANPGCMLQLRAGGEKFGSSQQVYHVIEVLDAAYAVKRK